MDRAYVTDVLVTLRQHFDTCRQQLVENDSILSEQAISALDTFEAVLDKEIDYHVNDPDGQAAIDHYGRVAARWIRLYAPALSPDNADLDNLALAVENLIIELEDRHYGEDRWYDARWHITDDPDQWDEFTHRAVSQMVGYTLPTHIAERAAKALQAMYIIAPDSPICSECGHAKAATHKCPIQL